MLKHVFAACGIVLPVELQGICALSDDCGTITCCLQGMMLGDIHRNIQVSVKTDECAGQLEYGVERKTWQSPISTNSMSLSKYLYVLNPFFYLKGTLFFQSSDFLKIFFFQTLY